MQWVKCGVCSVECGVWSVKCRVWSVRRIGNDFVQAL